MPARHGFGRPARRSGRKSVWLQFAFQSTTNVGNGSSIIFSLNAAALALRPFTIVRSHFDFYLHSDQAAAAENQVALWGAAVVSDQAAAVGITAVPTPNTELGSSLWFAIRGMFANATNLTDVTNGGQKYSLDSKAMRKVEVGQDVVLVEENPSSSGYILRMVGRILVKTN